MMDLIIIYRYQKDFFVAGKFSCPTVKAEDKISLLMKRAKFTDNIFIKNKIEAIKIIRNFKMKDFYPIKIYFEHEGYEIENSTIDKIKDTLGGAEAIWVNFEESQV